MTLAFFIVMTLTNFTHATEAQPCEPRLLSLLLVDDIDPEPVYRVEIDEGEITASNNFRELRVRGPANSPAYRDQAKREVLDVVASFLKAAPPRRAIGVLTNRKHLDTKVWYRFDAGNRVVFGLILPAHSSIKNYVEANDFSLNIEVEGALHVDTTSYEHATKLVALRLDELLR